MMVPYMMNQKEKRRIFKSFLNRFLLSVVRSAASSFCIILHSSSQFWIWILNMIFRFFFVRRMEKVLYHLHYSVVDDGYASGRLSERHFNIYSRMRVGGK